jgi:phage FluMu protein gp41
MADKKPGTGTLKGGLKIGDTVHRDFEIREGTMADYFAAEDMAGPEQPYKFTAALLCQQIVHIGDFGGALTVELLQRLRIPDFRMLRTEMNAVDGMSAQNPEIANEKPGAGTLKHGLKIGDTVHRDFEIREGTMADYFAAEDVVNPNKTYKFATALLCQRIVSIGDVGGPLTVDLLQNLPPADFHMLRAAMDGVDGLGESEPGAAPPG